MEEQSQADHAFDVQNHEDEISENEDDAVATSSTSSGHAKTGKNRKMIRHTAAQKMILGEYYRKGMTNGRVKHLVEEAATKSGLKICQVMSWINAQNKLARIRSGETLRRKNISIKPRPATQQTARYRLFMSDFMTGKSHVTDEDRTKVLKDAGKAWKKASKKKGVLKVLDGRIAKTPRVTVENLTSNQKRHRAAKLIKEIRGYCRQLDREMGYSTTVMSSHPQHGTLFTGNKFGRRYVEKNEFLGLRMFHFANGAKEFNQPKGRKRYDVKKTRQELRRRLNEKFCAATGNSQVSYQSIQDKTSPIEVTGWPDDLPFQNPSNFGEAKLKRLLSVVDEISFIRKGNDGSNTVENGDKSDDSSGESSSDSEEESSGKENDGTNTEENGDKSGDSSSDSEEESSEDIAELRRMVKGNKDDQEYIVEKIVRRVEKKGKTLYEVKWKDWDQKHNTLETKETLQNNLIFIEFENKRKGGKKRLKVTKS